MFRISTENVSRVVNGTSKLLFEKFNRGIEFDERQFLKENLERFSQAVFEKEAILPYIVGFIDGTIQQTCRPMDGNTYIALVIAIHCFVTSPWATPRGL
jgi:hypothetical protein